MDTITNLYYTTNADSFNDRTLNLTCKMQPLYDTFFKYLHSNLVLDVGCGTGRDSLYFQNHSLIVTSIDANREMIVKCIDNQVENPIHVSVEHFDSDVRYGGIWACASLLHLKRDRLPDIFNKLANLLNDNGVLYCSFKYGNFEGIRDHRYFTDMTESLLENVISVYNRFEIKEMYTTDDVRENVKQTWLNAFLIKN